MHRYLHFTLALLAACTESVLGSRTGLRSSTVATSLPSAQVKWE